MVPSTQPQTAPAMCHCGAPAALVIREGMMLHNACDDCYQTDFEQNEDRRTAWEIAQVLVCPSTPTPSTITAAVKRSLPTFTLTGQLEALRREAHTAQRQGLTQVVALLKERACALAESYLDDGHMCDRGHWLNEYGQCETCLEQAQQLACARMHVNETFQRWQFEAQTTDCPF